MSSTEPPEKQNSTPAWVGGVLTALVFLKEVAAEDNAPVIWLLGANASVGIIAFAWNRYKKGKNKSTRAAFAHGFLAVVTVLLCYFGVDAWQNAKFAEARAAIRQVEERDRRGDLLPGSFDSPPLPESKQPLQIPENAIKLFYGKSSLGWTEYESFVAIVHSDNEGIAVKRTKDGMAVTATFFDRNGERIGKMENNHFIFAKADDLLTVHRPADHILIVKDAQNQTVLEIEYLNPTTMLFRTDFYTKYGTRLRVTDENLRLDSDKMKKVTLKGLVSGNGGVLILTNDGQMMIGPLPPAGNTFTDPPQPQT